METGTFSELLSGDVSQGCACEGTGGTSAALCCALGSTIRGEAKKRLFQALEGSLTIAECKQP